MKPMLMCSTLISPEEMQKWPKLVSIKYDGIRCLTIGGQAVSRSLKPIPNRYVQEQLASLPPGKDGELVLRGEAGKEYNNNQSAFMSRDGKPDFDFMVFDDFTYPNMPMTQRALDLTKLEHPRVKLVEQHLFCTSKDVNYFYDLARNNGYEGLILKTTDSPYKFGRSTLKQEWGLKMKPFDDDEALVIGFTELEHNDNEAFENELGHTTRSTHQDNKTAGGMLGSLVCSYGGKEFRIGTGFDTATRRAIWENPGKYLGRTVKFKHQGITKYGVPRGPAVFLGWRDPIDMG